jgi:hypothetical protein
LKLFVDKIQIDEIEQVRAKKNLIIILFSCVSLLTLLNVYPIGEYHYFPPCPWYKLTGTYCPGCGTIRGIQSVLNGNIFGLLENNPLAALALPFLGLSLVSLSFQSFVGYKPSHLFLSKNEIWCILLIIILYWGLRNYWDLLAPKLI